jgi:pimeloyl-ACP methyl ester carboxylesterase
MAPAIEDIVGRYVEVRGTRTYYESCGDGPAFICVHSAGTDSRLFRHTLPAMGRLGFRAIAVDLPGHGKSFPIDWRPVDDLHEFAEWVMEFAGVVGADRPVVAGCSIGGNIAIDVAAHHSADVRACIAFEGAAYTPTFAGAATFMDPHTMCWESVSDCMAPTVIRPDATGDQLAEIAWLHKSTTQRVFASDLVGWQNQDVRARLGEVTAPLLVCLGTGDFFLPEQMVTDTTDVVETAKFVRLENLGHYPMWEDPATVNDVVTSFLSEHRLLPTGGSKPSDND